MESLGRLPRLRLARLRKQCHLCVKSGTNLDGIFRKVAAPAPVEAQKAALSICESWESLEGCRACAWRGLKSSATYEQNLEITLMESLEGCRAPGEQCHLYLKA